MMATLAKRWLFVVVALSFAGLGTKKPVMAMADICPWLEGSSCDQCSCGDWSDLGGGYCPGSFGDVADCFEASDTCAPDGESCDNSEFCADHEYDCNWLCEDEGLVNDGTYCPTGDCDFYCGCSYQ